MIEARLKVEDFDGRGEVGLVHAMTDPFLMRDAAHEPRRRVWAELFLENLDKSIGALRRAMATVR